MRFSLTSLVTTFLAFTQAHRMNILVTYATEQGSTRTIAERIQARLTEANVGHVTIAPVKPPPSLAGTDAVIVGSCIHIGSWLKPASAFAKNELAAFAKEHPEKPVWAFSVGMPTEGPKFDAEQEAMNKWIRGIVPTLRGHTLLLGRYQSEGVPWIMRTVLSWFGAKEDDRRDWNAINKWADKIAAELKPKEPERKPGKDEL